MGIKEFVITESDLLSFLQRLVEKRSLIAPVKNEFGDVFLLPVNTLEEICFDYENTINSPKEYLFPDAEWMFTFKEKKDSSLELTHWKEDFILFGLRACDTKAINLLDRFFKRDFEDTLYQEKRRHSTLITLICPRLWEECFCSSVGSGPLLEEGFDIQLIPLEGRYFAQIASEKGDILLDEFREFFKLIEDKDEKEFLEFRERIRTKEKRFNLDKVYNNLKENRVNPLLWQDIASRCQNCGLCLFICPSCSCFTINDKEKITHSAGRLRQWDGCYFRGFTRMAGSYDPIASLEEMVKRKYVHKLWQQRDEFGICGCTGCGRCNKVCLGNINWLDNLIKMEKSFSDV